MYSKIRLMSCCCTAIMGALEFAIVICGVINPVIGQIGKFSRAYYYRRLFLTKLVNIADETDKLVII